MKTIRFALALAYLLIIVGAVPTAYAFPSQTPSANPNVSLGALPTDGTPTTSAAFMGSTSYHAYHFALLYDVQNGDGTYLNIQTYDHTGEPAPGLDSVIGLYNSNGDKIAHSDDGNHVDNDPTRQFMSMLTFGDSDPLGSNPNAVPGPVTAGANGLVSADWYTLVVAPFDVNLEPDDAGYATLPDLLAELDTFSFNSAFSGDYTVQFVYDGQFAPGDFNTDATVDAADIDLLAANNGNTTNAVFDLDGDGLATFAYSPNGIHSDSDELVRNLLETEYGDANLSRTVSIGDLSILAQNFGMEGVGWAEGDFSGDSRVSIGDLSILAQKFGFSNLGSLGSPAVAMTMVPEPHGGLLAVLAAFGCFPWPRAGGRLDRNLRSISTERRNLSRLVAFANIAHYN